MARIDLRSDTVTHPTDAMRHAMAAAEVGDDVFGDDPTINALEARAAELLGKEAGLFVASGTMGNLVSLMAHLPRGSEAIAGASTHTLMDEAGNHAVVVGATIRPIQERPDGTMDPQEVADAWRDPDDLHEPLTGLVILEQTHAHSGGRALPLDYVRTIGAIAHERGVPLHIDGARLFNATVALGVTPAEMAAPGRLGHVLPVQGPRGAGRVGRRRQRAVHRPGPPRAEAHRRRHAPGGRPRGGRPRRAGRGPGRRRRHDRAPRRGPRQRATPRRRPRRPSTASARRAGSRSPTRYGDRLDPTRIATNFVLFRVDRDRAAFLAALEARGVLLVPYAHGQVRAVTHDGITADDIDAVIAAVAEVLREHRAEPGRRTGDERRLSVHRRADHHHRAHPARHEAPTSRAPEDR